MRSSAIPPWARIFVAILRLLSGLTRRSRHAVISSAGASLPVMKKIGCVSARLAPPKNGAQGPALDWQEIIRTCKPDEAWEIGLRVEVDLPQPLRIERQHRCDISARRMSHQHQPRGIAAPLRGIVAGKTHRSRGVFDKRREPRRRE